jgi:hypothetical protein
MRSNGFGVIPCGDAPEAGSDARADIPSEQGRLSPKLRVLAVEDAPLDVELDCLASAISVPALRSGSSSTIRIFVFSLCHREQVVRCYGELRAGGAGRWVRPDV